VETDPKPTVGTDPSAVTVGHVHGRFQPFHREHLEYAAWAARESDELLVGITNADPSHVATEDADPKRHEPRHNPFSYHERHRMIRAAIAASEISVPVGVVPFPINRPELWDAYAPGTAVFFVNVLEEWHEVKADRLREYGLTVRTKAGTRTVSGTDIRHTMAGGRDGWRDDVPDPAAEVIEAVGGPERVRRLHDGG
jgi:nicotinamide-nucleotide adenylyltransferase